MYIKYAYILNIYKLHIYIMYSAVNLWRWRKCAEPTLPDERIRCYPGGAQAEPVDRSRNQVQEHHGTTVHVHSLFMFI